MKIKLLLFFSLVSTLSFSQSLTEFIVIDQFGYRPESEKIAVIRNPQTGYDSGSSFSPGSDYALVDANTNTEVYTASPVEWNSGQEDITSGDEAWWFDFSTVELPGTYYVLDKGNNVRSFDFEIRSDIYNEVLKQAVRSFFYQRVGYEKQTPYAEASWADGASHIGSLQDTECRSYDAPSDAATERDVRGGWYDAGDYNKYTNWTSNYIYEMLAAYEEYPEAWGDDYDLPESGNGIPDILDEAKWGMDHLLRLQNSNGSMIAIVDESHASPPSAATGQSLYGDVNTSATINSSGTFAYGAKVFKQLGLTSYATTLEQAAKDAWDWADANPNVIWRNNDAAYNSSGIGSGQQETDDYGRFNYKLRAAVHLYEITETTSYKTFFESNYTDVHAIQWPYIYPYETREQQTLLYYTTLDNASSSVRNNIVSKYKSSITGSDINIPAYTSSKDPYMAYLDSYTWGSNGIKGNQGSNLYAVKTYEIDASSEEDAVKAAEHYVHYLHGVNPLNKVYLTNMYEHGADNCADEIYHTWFHDGTDWDKTGVSAYGPAPGFVPGGANSNYDWDGCCPSNCGGVDNNAVCTSISINPPKDQPQQKSYADFNTTWPINSWSVTENSCGYQLSYIRLLSKFVDKDAVVLSVDKEDKLEKVLVFPNPANDQIQVQVPYGFNVQKVTLLTTEGKVALEELSQEDLFFINVSALSGGVYLLKVEGSEGTLNSKVVIQ